MSGFTEPSSFKSLEDKRTTRRALNPPQCIVDLPEENHSRIVLNDEQASVARTELMKKEFTKLEFPRTMKLHVDPPVNGQYMGLVSFIPSKNATPDKDGCYGVLKLRGNYSTEKEADSWAENIIRQHDSYASIDYCFVGKPFPLMENNEVYRAATREIDIRRKVDEVQREDLRQKRENDRSEMESVNKRHRELMRSVEEDKVQSVDDIELYTQLRTKKAHLMYNTEELKRKIKESEEIIKRVNGEIADMDVKYPEYKNEFMSRYKSALSSAGINVETSPLLKYMM